MAAMPIRIVIAVVIGLLLVAAAYLFLFRSPVEAPSAVLDGVTIECDPWTGVSAGECGAWGDAILDEGPPSRTFNMTDLDRVVLSGSPIGIMGACRIAYYLGRNPTSPVWDEETACASG